MQLGDEAGRVWTHTGGLLPCWVPDRRRQARAEIADVVASVAQSCPYF
jgi:hypothetical protein